MTIPTVTVNKEATLVIILRDSYNGFLIGEREKLSVSVSFDKTMEQVIVKPIKELSGGRYKASFTASRCGHYTISIIVDGYHIPDDPHK